AERDHAHAGSAELARGGPVVAAGVEHDEVRMHAEYGLDVRPEPRAEVGHEAGRVGPEIPMRAPHETRTGADGEQQIGGGGTERDDARRLLERAQRDG